ncbi:MAG: DNA-3-methyladenine glycosylase 2 family protein [Candidatus Thorarchaeota archaeon]|nr:DNA-3-methyladenine glycosylase 2 family protein [Candidatus Thorarchaeota archaeon]
MSFRVNVPKGYDLLSSVHSWIYPEIQPVPERTGDGYFGRAYTLDNQHVAFIIRQTNPGESLRVSHSVSDLGRHDLRTLVKRTLGLEIKIEEALIQMGEDPIVAHLVPRIAGIRPYMSPTPFEALIKTITQQQISYRAANIFTKRMILGLTKPVSYKDQSWYYFPDAHTISTSGLDGLRKFGFGYKTEYIHGVARLVAKGELDIDSFVGVPYEEVLAALKPIKGIGEWTIRVLSLAGLGNFTVFAYGDLVIQKILGNLYNQGKRMTAKQVREHSETWGDSSTMVLYLLMNAEVLGFLKS